MSRRILICIFRQGARHICRRVDHPARLQSLDGFRHCVGIRKIEVMHIRLRLPAGCHNIEASAPQNAHEVPAEIALSAGDEDRFAAQLFNHYNMVQEIQ